MKSKRTKALAIKPKVREAIKQRDNGCIICGSLYRLEMAHFISRAKSGLGIPENIVTLCQKCHHEFDNTVKRNSIRAYIMAYLDIHYPDFTDEDRRYKKYAKDNN